MLAYVPPCRPNGQAVMVNRTVSMLRAEGSEAALPRIIEGKEERGEAEGEPSVVSLS